MLKGRLPEVCVLLVLLTLFACGDAPPAGPAPVAAPADAPADAPTASAPWTRQSSSLTTEVLSGEPVERVLVDGYSYLRLGEQWVAVPGAVEDDEVVVQALARIEGYHSKQLDRTFDDLVFGYLKER